MVTGSLVDGFIDSGQQLLHALKAQNFEVAAAFWVKTCERQSWLLYIASPEVEKQGRASAYKVIGQAIRRLPDSFITGLEVKLIAPEHPLAVDVLRFRKVWPNGAIARRDGVQVGADFFEELYVYPAL